ncbi:MAG TPA: ABC transporter ATP-binding protein [Candidatus Kapabacteria bacterium]|nr:ABC transporter ATP-binding protein [Candidatus Kapabacteria bacterium]
MNDVAIAAHGLGRQFGNLKAVDGLDLQVPRQRIYGFLGPNGCGKTTAIRMLTGLLKPTSGEVNVLGLRLPQQANALRYKIGYMTQKFSLYGDLTVQENLQFVAQIYGITGSHQKQRVAELLSIYDLGSQAGQLAGSMSGGQRQRLALAAAVIHKPELLFLDEPTSAVDPENRRLFWEQLFDLCDAGTTILVSTHYMDEAERCHKLAILETGQKRADGSPAELMDNMGAHVVEIVAPELRRLKEQLLTVAGILSAAQLGARLRVLVSRTKGDPVIFLRAQAMIAPDFELQVVRPSLEDVFVTSTGSARQAANGT